MRIGIDFDNTIVCYDDVFQRVAFQDGLIPGDVSANKSAVRDYLRKIGREDAWTELQGRVYGSRMWEANPYPGAKEFFHQCRLAGLPLYIISHKTRFPYLGQRYDLHLAAYDWLEFHGFFDPNGIGLPRDQVFFELTKEAKLRRIGDCECSHFVDDLPEFLSEAAFPPRAFRILFDPSQVHLNETRFARASHWRDVPGLIGVEFKGPTFPGGGSISVPAAAVEDPALSEPIRESIRRLLRDRGSETAFTSEMLAGGANNRVRRIRAGAESFAFKLYYYNPADSRDRFGAERAFYSWGWSRGVRRMPEPIGWHTEHRFGLFRFIEGRKLRMEEVDAERLDEAAAFIAEINRERQAPEAATIPVASEACFSFADHHECIHRRVERLTGLQPLTELDHEASAFIREELHPAWTQVRDELRTPARDSRDTPLTASARCLSPSDFGFHNALLGSDGTLRFFDFEYAGWDDPAKLVCDFFCQPQIPVDRKHWGWWVAAIDAALGWGGSLEERAGLLFPAYRIKWCCILLNEFLRADLARREFAQAAEKADARKEEQLRKARRALAEVTKS